MQRSDPNAKSELLNKAFFLRGFARSGTNWLCNLINLHPDIYCHGEFHFEEIAKGVRLTKSKPYGLLRANSILDEQFELFIDNTIKSLCHGAPIYGDRTPIKIEDCLIPKRKYIVIYRDVRDVLVSLYYHNFKHPNLEDHPEMIEKRRLFLENKNYFEENKKALLDCEEITRNWAKLWNDQILSDSQHTQNQNELDIEVMPVSYEILHSDTENIREQIYSFLGVNFFDAIPIDDNNRPGVKNPEMTAHNRKGLAGDWRNYFTNEQLTWVKDEANEGMKWIHDEFKLPLEW